jgi:hypothetical protein
MTKMIIKNTGATQQVVINFENFVKQWDEISKQLKANSNQEVLEFNNFKAEFDRKKKYLRLYLKWVNLSITKQWAHYPVNYNGNKYLRLFSTYLLANYYLLHKELRKNNQFVNEKTKFLVDNFFNWFDWVPLENN